MHAKQSITVMSHEHHSISNHWKTNHLYNHLFMLTTKNTSYLCITGSLWGVDSSNKGLVPVLPSKVANSEGIFISWHHVLSDTCLNDGLELNKLQATT